MYFRSNEQSAQLHKDKFKVGIKSMKRLVVDSKDSILSTVLLKGSNATTKSFS
jgi:hypothetical protein